jgi:hypothetical protein
MSSGTGDDSKNEANQSSNEEAKPLPRNDHKKITISELAKNAFGAPAKPIEDLPVQNTVEEASMPVLNAGGNAPAFGRLVQDYLSKNPGTAQGGAAVDTQSLEDAFKNNSDLLAVIAQLKSVPPGAVRDQLCKKATEAAHKFGKLETLDITGVHEEKDALLVRDWARGKSFAIDHQSEPID